MSALQDLQEEVFRSKEREEYYKNLSEVYLAELEDFQDPIHKIMIAKGILIEIESDLLEFLKKSKATEKSRKQEERIGILSSVMDYFSNVASTNYQMKLMLRQAAEDLRREHNRHRNTEKALEMATNILNEG